MSVLCIMSLIITDASVGYTRLVKHLHVDIYFRYYFIFSFTGPAKCKPTQIINNIFLLRFVWGLQTIPSRLFFYSEHFTEVCSPAEGSTVFSHVRGMNLSPHAL